MSVTAIQLSTEFTKDHQRALVQYIINPNGLTQAERQTLFQAIDLLRNSQVTVDGITLTFSEFYRRFVDETYADAFINTLLASDAVEAVGVGEGQPGLLDRSGALERPVQAHWWHRGRVG